MKTNRFLILVRLAGLLLLAGLFAGCFPIIPTTGQRSVATTQPSQNASGTPSVAVSDQNYDGTTVTVADVYSAGPGWMVIHSQQNGVVGPAIGFTAVKSGDNKNVKVRIDPKQATPVLYAMLHVDVGVVGKYEFPGPDAPVFVGGQMVSPPFKATTQSDVEAQVTPKVAIQSQQVQDSKVIVQEVDSNGPGWIAIHIQNPDGSPGDEIGFTAVKAGESYKVSVIVDSTKMTKVLYAMLHKDAGQVGMYEFPGPDEPVMVNGAMVAQAFTSDGSALGPQPTLTGMGEMSATMSPGGSSPTGMAMGTTPAATTMATIAATAAASATMAMPTTAPTASPTVGMVMDTPVPGVNPVVKVSDQTLSNGMVKVDQVVSSGPGWIVIYTTNSSGQPDQIIGHAAVKSGANLNVMVPVDPAKATGTLYAQLHADMGKMGTFEYPGADAPVMIGVTMISGSFKIGQPGAQPTAAAQATEMVPSVTVADQPIIDSSITIPQVVANGDMWVVIHRVNGDGSMGVAAGHALVHNGVNTNVIVKLDTTLTSSTMAAMLHLDVAKKSSPDFPGQDQPVMVNGQMVAPIFHVTLASNGDVILNVATDANGNTYLVDGRNMTMYISLSDQRGKSNCTGECLNSWNPVFATGQVVTGPGINAKAVSVILRADGSRQLTYNGAPLYYYVNDLNSGDMKGQGLNGNWFTVNP